MGPSADRRQRPGGETVRFYSRLPAGRETYAARFGSDGKLIAIEQRLTRENAARLAPGRSTKEDARDVLGPPYRTIDFPRLGTQAWRYPMNDGAVRRVIAVEFSADGRVLDVMIFDDDED